MRDEPYLTGPRRSRTAPWVVGLFILALLASGLAVTRDSWIAPLFLLAGAAVLAQVIDALRTGELIAIFPNRWPVRASRLREPVTFWVLTTLFALVGGFWFVIGAVGIAALAFGVSVSWR